MLKIGRSLICAGLLIALAGTGALAQVTKSGEGESAKYTLAKKYAESVSYDIVVTTENTRAKDTPVEKKGTVTATFKDGKLSYHVEPDFDTVVADEEIEVDEHGLKAEKVPLKLFSILELPLPKDAVAVDEEWKTEKFVNTEDDKEQTRITFVDEEEKTATIEVSLVSNGLGINAEIVISTEDGLIKSATVTWEDGDKLHSIELKRK